MKSIDVYAAIFFLCSMILALCFINRTKQNLDTQCIRLQLEIDELNEQITEDYNLYENEEENMKQRNIELGVLCLWLKEPNEEDDFERIVQIGETLNISRDELFKRYIDYEITQKYMTYISANGVRTYLASAIRQRLLPSFEYDSEKWMYDSKVKPYEAKIPDNLLTKQLELENFLTIMESQYPLPKKK